jgi:hypothetical protein
MTIFDMAALFVPHLQYLLQKINQWSMHAKQNNLMKTII